MATEEGVTIEEMRVEALRASFRQGVICNDEGQRLLVEEEVGRFLGLTVHIYGREHPPPHFCVRYQNESANFSIEKGERLPRNKGLDGFERNIKRWWKENRDYLIERWNATRPSDCPVGPIEAELAGDERARAADIH